MEGDNEEVKNVRSSDEDTTSAKIAQVCAGEIVRDNRPIVSGGTQELKSSNQMAGCRRISKAHFSPKRLSRTRTPYQINPLPPPVKLWLSPTQAQ